MVEINFSGSSDIVQKFEGALARTFLCPHAVTTNSGTTAIFIALKILFPAGGKRIAISPLAPAMSYIPIVLSKNIPVFIDVDLDYPFSLDPRALESQLSESTIDAVITVGMWGRQPFSRQVVELLNKFGILHVEDIAQSQFASYLGKPIGTFGVIGCGSLHNNKLLQTGEGGYLLCQQLTYAERAQEIREFGGRIFSNNELFLKLKHSGYGARAGLDNLQYIKDEITHRKLLFNLCDQKFCGNLGLHWPKEDPEFRSSSYGFTCIAASEKDRNEIHRVFHEGGAICDSQKYKLGLAFETYPWLSEFSTSCPNADRISKSTVGFRLPAIREAAAREILETILERI